MFLMNFYLVLLEKSSHKNFFVLTALMKTCGQVRDVLEANQKIINKQRLIKKSLTNNVSESTFVLSSSSVKLGLTSVNTIAEILKFFIKCYNFNYLF